MEATFLTSVFTCLLLSWLGGGQDGTAGGFRCPRSISHLSLDWVPCKTYNVISETPLTVAVNLPSWFGVPAFIMGAAAI